MNEFSYIVPTEIFSVFYGNQDMMAEISATKPEENKVTLADLQRKIYPDVLER